MDRFWVSCWTTVRSIEQRRSTNSLRDDHSANTSLKTSYYRQKRSIKASYDKTKKFKLDWIREHRLNCQIRQAEDCNSIEILHQGQRIEEGDQHSQQRCINNSTGIECLQLSGEMWLCICWLPWWHSPLIGCWSKEALPSSASPVHGDNHERHACTISYEDSTCFRYEHSSHCNRCLQRQAFGARLQLATQRPSRERQPNYIWHRIGQSTIINSVSLSLPLVAMLKQC